MKITPPIAIGICVVAIMFVVFAGNMIYHKASGGDAVSTMNSTMDKAKPGQAPFSAQQMDHMKKQGQ